MVIVIPIGKTLGKAFLIAEKISNAISFCFQNYLHIYLHASLIFEITID